VHVDHRENRDGGDDPAEGSPGRVGHQDDESETDRVVGAVEAEDERLALEAAELHVDVDHCYEREDSEPDCEVRVDPRVGRLDPSNALRERVGTHTEVVEQRDRLRNVRGAVTGVGLEPVFQFLSRVIEVVDRESPAEKQDDVLGPFVEQEHLEAGSADEVLPNADAREAQVRQRKDRVVDGKQSENRGHDCCQTVKYAEGCVPVDGLAAGGHRSLFEGEFERAFEARCGPRTARRR
jgi:hypothetical protein